MATVIARSSRAMTAESWVNVIEKCSKLDQSTHRLGAAGRNWRA
jgi:hypothetical protein